MFDKYNSDRLQSMAQGGNVVAAAELERRQAIAAGDISRQTNAERQRMIRRGNYETWR